MATNIAVAEPPARQDPRQVENTLKLRLDFNTANAATGVTFANSLPQGAYITNVEVEVATAFNAATTNIITVGTNTATYNNVVSAGDVNPAATGVTAVTRGWGRSIANATDTLLQATYSQTGTSATQGTAFIVVTFEGGWAS